MKYPRYMKAPLEAALVDTPVVLIHGPRQSGKSTLAIAVGGEKYSYITFDEDAILAAARNDPKGFIEDLPPYCILDEIQRIPELFTSIKLSVDKDRRPGRFLLTGSANILLLPQLGDSLAGRMEVIRLQPLSQIEIHGSETNYLSLAFDKQPKGSFDHRLRDDLVDRITQGGFPEPLQRSTQKRQRAWYRNYIATTVEREISEISNIRYGADIPILLEKIANNTACLVNFSKLSQGLLIDQKTTKHYVDLMSQVFLINTLRPWHSNRNSRLVKTPKLHVTDTGLLSNILRMNKQQLANEREILGQFLETFIYNELLRLSGWYEQELQFFHYRDNDQFEVDIIILNEEGQILGVEVKLAASVSEKDFKGLKHFKKQYLERFVGGHIFYDGERVLSFGEGMYAVPIQCLWASTN